MKKLILFLFLIALLSGCVKDDEPQLDYSICNLDMDSFDLTYGIDYSSPEKYLLPGGQSEIDEALFREIRDSIGAVPQSLTGVLKICHWINRNFNKINGNDIGNKTIQQLYALGTIYDSHSAALVISGTLRKFGFPTVMIETASVQWAYNYRLGDKSMYNVHVMSEVFVNNKWILLDNNCTLVADYNPENPFIPAMNKNLYPQGLFVYAKGLDSWGYGVYRARDTRDKITDFANNIICFENLLNSASYVWKN